MRNVIELLDTYAVSRALVVVVIAGTVFLVYERESTGARLVDANLEHDASYRNRLTNFPARFTKPNDTYI